MPTEAKADIPMVVLRDHGHAPKERNASMHSGTTAASDNDGDDDADPVVDPNLVCWLRVTCNRSRADFNTDHLGRP